MFRTVLQVFSICFKDRYATRRVWHILALGKMHNFTDR